MTNVMDFLLNFHYVAQDVIGAIYDQNSILSSWLLEPIITVPAICPGGGRSHDGHDEEVLLKDNN